MEDTEKNKFLKDTIGGKLKAKFQIKSIFGNVLFELEKKDNTFKRTVGAFLEVNKGELIEGADLSRQDLSGISFYNSSFYNSSFDNSSFDNSSFDNSRFYNSRFYNSSFYNSRFYNSSFDNSRFYNSSFDNSSFDNSRFDNSRFYNSRFYNSRFYNSSFYSSSFDNSRFDNSRFDNSRFDSNSEIKSNCNLSGVLFNGTTTPKRYISISGIGSAKRMSTYCFEDNKIWCGCWSGTLKEFEHRVKDVHAKNKQYLDEYLYFVGYLKKLKHIKGEIKN